MTLEEENIYLKQKNTELLDRLKVLSEYLEKILKEIEHGSR